MVSGIAILGAGLFATQAYIPALKALGDSAPPLKAVYSRSEKSSSELSHSASELLKLESPPEIYFDADSSRNLDALLKRSDIEAVIIVLPITVQPEIVLKALAAGKHVLSEKPIAPDVAKGISLIKEAAKYTQKGLVWRVAENYEVETAYMKAGELVKSGAIGKVAFFKAIVYNYIDKSSQWYKTPWRTVPDYQGGFLLDGGVHTVAVLRTILSDLTLTHVSGFASLTKDYLAPHDAIHTIVRAGPDVHGLVEMTFASPVPTKPPADNILITGTDGWLSVNHANDAEGGIKILIKKLVKKGSEEDKVEETEESFRFPIIGVQEEFRAFFAKIDGVEGFEAGDPKDALLDVAFIQAALTSEGKLVDLGQLMREG
ncbi:oxidoreductase family protein [Dendrothele bispora CBS 962.96]|uniref:Oxidoreductase family protein n=1 Tax=Dendrothele bispora (strain CBS 962.96) TaxID=1314807 RepID=A0A4S8LMX2_DENBC|nr:oxidoreductase family protein [Dendrothele bispora CBS 962.96]